MRAASRLTTTTGRRLAAALGVAVGAGLLSGCGPGAEAERAADGRPLIATDLGGPREIVVHNETGIRVPPNDPHALGTAIERLLNNPDRAEAMGRSGQARYDSRYRAKDNVVKIEHLYAELCGDGPA